MFNRWPVPVNVAIVIATVILATTAIAMAVFLARRKREAREDELKQAASARGWTFDSRSERGYRIHRWTGATDGVSWRAESLHYTSNNKHQRRPDLARWHGDFSAGINGPIVIIGVPAGKDLPAAATGERDGFLAKLAQKAIGFAFDKAIDLYFGNDLGKQVDAAALHRVPAASLPRFVVMAADKEEGARIMSQGLERALAAAADDKGSAFAGENRASILLRPHGISLARLGQFRDVNELDRFIHAGVGLTRSFRFARPFA